MGCGGERIFGVMMGLLVVGALGSLAALIALFVDRGSLGVLCVVLECFICCMRQARMLASVECHIMWVVALL